MKNPEFKAAVEISREWEGDKVAKELVGKLKAKTPNPKFILLFTTIHYEKEFKKILSGIKNAFPDSPLIGGTIAGFITPEGCFTRGVTALTVDYPNMEVSIGVGHNTKRNPEKAVDEAVEMIDKKMKSKDVDFIISFTAGPTLPSIKGVDKWVVKVPFLEDATIKLLELSTKKLQKGHGREEEIIENLSKKYNDSYILGGSSSDNITLKKSYEFFNNDVLTNSLTLIAVKWNGKFKIKSIHGFHPVGKKILHVKKKGFDGKVVCKIDDKSATEAFLEAVNWPEKFFDERLHRRTFFYPLSFKNEDGILCPMAIGGILNNSFVFSYSMKGNNLIPLTASGKDLIDCLKKVVNKSNLTFSISCCALQEALGSNVYKIYEIFKNKNSVFLLIFTLGESAYLPSKKPLHLNESYNLGTFNI
jgi:hypothetical protein